MPISLNSPKYADVNSLAYQMYKKQQNRKRRKNPFVPELFERHFRRNEGTTDYATMPEVTLTGDLVIGIDALINSSADSVLIGRLANTTELLIVFASGEVRFRDSSGNSTSSAAGAFVFGQVNSIEVVKIGNSVSIIQNGIQIASGFSDANVTLDLLYKYQSGLNLSGILANLKIYDNDTLVRDYPLDDNSDTLRDRANGQSGSVVNGNASDWGLFQQQTTGEWLGQELIVNGGFDTDLSGWATANGASAGVVNGQCVLTQDNNGNGQIAASTSPLSLGLIYRYSIDLISTTSLLSVDSRVNNVFIPLSIGSNAMDTAVITATGLTAARHNNQLSGVVTVIDNVSVKEVLNVA